MLATALLDIQLCFKVVFTCQKVVRSAEKVKKGEKVRNICQKVVQLADKGEKKNEKVKKGENKLKIYDYLYIWTYFTL